VRLAMKDHRVDRAPHVVDSGVPDDIDPMVKALRRAAPLMRRSRHGAGPLFRRAHRMGGGRRRIP
jgi:hypothetical protein